MSVTTPDWVKDAIFYQIFPDRFAKSTRVEKPHHLEMWDAPPTIHGFKGGDLLGVVEHLDHLQELGVNAIYFCPIFQSTANHRYHTHDYFNVDPILGGNVAFKKLLDAAHAKNIRVVIDGVFNHASRGFYYFNHALENGRESPYLDWFTFTKFPLHAYHDGQAGYAAWWNDKALPKLNTFNPQVREYIMRVAEYWVEQGIDGWRLDVPGEIDDDTFWREFRTRVKAKNDEAYIVGEIWHRADRWLVGDQFDAVMNYQFTRAALSFCIGAKNAPKEMLHTGYGNIVNADAAAFAEMLEQVQTWYPPEITYAQMNLLDSHDTARFISVAKGDTTALKLAWLAMFTYPGTPTIYYGDEIGMEGGMPVEEARRGMIWDKAKWDLDLFETAKKYIALRKKYRALRRPGGYARLYAQGMVYSFARQLEGETVIVAMNASDKPVTLDLNVGAILKEGVHLNREWERHTRTVQHGQVSEIEIPARDGVVWSAKES